MISHLMSTKNPFSLNRNIINLRNSMALFLICLEIFSFSYFFILNYNFFRSLFLFFSILFFLFGYLLCLNFFSIFVFIFLSNLFFLFTFIKFNNFFINCKSHFLLQPFVLNINVFTNLFLCFIFSFYKNLSLFINPDLNLEIGLLNSVKSIKFDFFVLLKLNLSSNLFFIFFLFTSSFINFLLFFIHFSINYISIFNVIINFIVNYISLIFYNLFFNIFEKIILFNLKYNNIEIKRKDPQFLKDFLINDIFILLEKIKNNKLNYDRSLFITVPQINKNFTKKYKTYSLERIKNKLNYNIYLFLYKMRFRHLYKAFIEENNKITKKEKLNLEIDLQNKIKEIEIFCSLKLTKNKLIK